MISIDALLRSRLALVPIPLGQKGPIGYGWNLRQNAITDPANACMLEGMNIGLAHAYCSPVPTCAIDIDDYKQSKIWLSENGIDLDSLLKAPDAVVVHSGKINSLKLLYRLPENSKALASTFVKSVDGKMMLEFRCASATGLTVQDVLPPSLHPSGTKYEWIGRGSVLNMPVIPGTLLMVWSGLLTARCKAPNVCRAIRPETPREVAQVQNMLTFISADCDYETWRSIVWGLLSNGWKSSERLAREWSMTAPQRYSESAFELLISSYDPRHLSSPSLGTVYHYARLGGWNG